MSLGFSIHADFDPPLAEDDIAVFVEGFIETVEDAELECGGGANQRTADFAVSSHKTTNLTDEGVYLDVTDEQRLQVMNWLTLKILPMKVKVSPLFDLNEAEPPTDQWEIL